jgi:hypothetical protein
MDEKQNEIKRPGDKRPAFGYHCRSINLKVYKKSGSESAS